MPAKEVVDKAQSEGIKLSIAQVYNIRSVSRKNKPTKPRVKAPTAAAPAAPTRSAAAAPAASSGAAEDRLRKLIAEVGLARTREVLAEVQSAFSG